MVPPEIAGAPPDAADDSPWRLAAVIAVDPADRVQCQCKGCGQGVYARIHMIVWADGRIECWGSECYARELGSIGAEHAAKAMFPGLAGRRLTADERALLTENREALIASFREAMEREAEETKRRELERQRIAEAETAAFARELAQRRKAGNGERPRSARVVGTDPRLATDPLYVEAYRTVVARWEADHADHTLPGLVSMFEAEVTREQERLRSGRA